MILVIIKEPTLIRRLAKRMTEVNVSKLGEYKSMLHNNEGEVKKLCKEFLINVTKFFRDPQAYDTLKNRCPSAYF